MDVSSDERQFVAYGTLAQAATNTYIRKLGLFDASKPDSPVQTLDPNPQIKVNGGEIVFAPAGKALAYIIRDDRNVENIWLQPLDGKPGKQITQFKSDFISGFLWSPDQKKLHVARGHMESDVILLRDTSK